MVGGVAVDADRLRVWHNGNHSGKVTYLKASVRLLSAVALVALSILGSAGCASAQQSTTATYGDWVVRCATRATKPPRKICDMEQMTEVRGKNVPLSRIVIAHPLHGQPLKLVAQLPVNVWLPTGVKLFLAAKDQGISGRFTRCTPGGCFAAIDLSNAQLKTFGSQKKPGRLIFKNAGGHEVAIPVSFKGFSQAFETLSKE